MATVMRWLDFWHPSNHRLRVWLDTGGPAGVGEHVEQCERCADRLVEFDSELHADELETPSSSLRQALTALLAPPDDLPQRVLDGVESRARGGDDLRLLGEMFSIGIETAQLMFVSDDDHTHPDGGAQGRSTARSRAADDEKDDGS
jgi:hypothetical protein